MKLSKLILPILIIIVVVFIYSIYFAPKKTLGSFDAFDTNSNQNRDIRVEVVKDKELRKDESAGAVIFYARDSNGTEVVVNAPMETPDNIMKSDAVILHGHLHTDHFHATEVKID